MQSSAVDFFSCQIYLETKIKENLYDLVYMLYAICLRLGLSIFIQNSSIMFQEGACAEAASGRKK